MDMAPSGAQANIKEMSNKQRRQSAKDKFSKGSLARRAGRKGFDPIPNPNNKRKPGTSTMDLTKLQEAIARKTGKRPVEMPMMGRGVTKGTVSAEAKQKFADAKGDMASRIRLLAGARNTTSK